MFQLAPTKADQAGLRYWMRNRYKAFQNGVRWSNRAYLEAEQTAQRHSQVRLRPILLTDEQKKSIARDTGSSPFLEVTFVPVARGRAKSQTKKGKK